MQFTFHPIWTYFTFISDDIKYTRAEFGVSQSEFIKQQFRGIFEKLSAPEQKLFLQEFVICVGTSGVTNEQASQALLKIFYPEDSRFRLSVLPKVQSFEMGVMIEIMRNPPLESKYFFERYVRLLESRSNFEEHLDWLIKSYQAYQKASGDFRVSGLFYKRMLDAINWNLEKDDSRARFLQVLSVSSPELFWEYSESLRTTDYKLWVSVIVDAVGVDQNEVSVLKGTEVAGEKIITDLTIASTAHTDLYSFAATIAFFAKLTAPDPKEKILGAWKKVDIKTFNKSNLLKLITFMNEIFPKTNNENTFTITSENMSQFFIDSQDTVLF